MRNTPLIRNHDEIGRLTAQQEKGVIDRKTGKLLRKLGVITSLLPFTRWFSNTTHTFLVHEMVVFSEQVHRVSLILEQIRRCCVHRLFSAESRSAVALRNEMTHDPVAQHVCIVSLLVVWQPDSDRTVPCRRLQRQSRTQCPIKPQYVPFYIQVCVQIKKTRCVFTVRIRVLGRNIF